MNNDYDVTQEKFLHIHLQTLIGITIIAFAAEVIFFFILSWQGVMETNIRTYFIKYVLFPTGVNGVCSLIGWRVCVSNNLERKKKQYVVSLMVVCVSFIIAIVHGTFSSVYLLFIFVILFTVFYGDKVLTTVTFFCSLIGRCISAVFCIDRSVTVQAEDLTELLLAVIMLCGMYVFSLTMIRLEIEKRELLMRSVKAWAQLREESQVDNVTGLFNRRALEEYQVEIEKMSPGHQPGYIVMWDIDDFKEINDNYGHLQGDKILTCVGECCLSHRDDMICFRYGGDEFCAVLFSNDRADSAGIIRDIQQKLYQYATAAGDRMPITISVGITKYEAEVSTTELIGRADEALYYAKKNLKGDIVFFEE